MHSDRLFEGGIVNFRVDTVKLPGGASAVREVVEHSGGVVIACRPKPDQIILIRQYRYSIDDDLIELPAGRIEHGEDPLLAAQRELEEETGYRAKQWNELSRMYSAPGFCNEVLYLYEAADIEFVGTNPDADEEIEVLQLEIAEAWRLVQQEKVQDAKTIAGLGLLLAAKHL